MATERTVILVPENPRWWDPMDQPWWHLVSVPWCVVHDAEAVNEQCWEALWQSGVRKFGPCDVQDGVVWKVVES